MLRRLNGLIPAAEVAALREIAERHDFADGKGTAGDLVQGVKRNRQLDDAGPDQATIDRIVLGALMRSREFNDAALPRLMMRPMLNLYTAGMEYGFHVDNPIMNPGAPVRTDISVTVFLSDPRSYEGGELVIQMPAGTANVKLEAGDAIVYPATRVHRVAPVTQGARLAAITWGQSLVADEAEREILADLNVAMGSLAQRVPGAPENDLLFKTYANLIRRWSRV